MEKLEKYPKQIKCNLFFDMQNGFQICPGEVLCFIIIRNVSYSMPAGNIVFPLFSPILLKKHFIAYFTIHIIRD